MSLYDDFWEEAGRQRAQWVRNQMRLLDPRELCHVTLVEFRGRPLYWELHCRGRVISSFAIKTALL